MRRQRAHGSGGRRTVPGQRDVAVTPGEESGPFTDRIAIAEVPLEQVAASELCKRAALSVAGTRTPAKLEDSRQKANSHFGGETDEIVDEHQSR